MTGAVRAFALIGNPVAGGGRGASVLAEAERRLQAEGVGVRAASTTSLEHARALATLAARSGETAVAVGGDGLLGAVAGAVAAAGGGTVGLVPAGRGNDFARTVAVPTATGDAVALLLAGIARPTDAIAITHGDQERIVLGNSYVGFDSLSNAAANRQRLNLGRFAYIAAAARVAITARPYDYELVIDGEPHAYRGDDLVIANGGWYGGGVNIAPTADPHDGLLDVLCFGPTPLLKRAPTLLAVRGGRHLGRPGVEHRRAREISVRMRPALQVYADGDPICSAPFAARVLPGAFDLIRP